MKAPKKTRAGRAQKTVQILNRSFPVQKDGRAEIAGHLLTNEQIMQLRRNAEDRLEITKEGTVWERQDRAFRTAFDNLLFQHRPTSTAPDWFYDVWGDANKVLSALMGLKDYPFYHRGATGRRGIQAVWGLHSDLVRVADALALMLAAMAAEGELKLHEMIKRREQFESLRTDQLREER